MENYYRGYYVKSWDNGSTVQYDVTDHDGYFYSGHDTEQSAYRDIDRMVSDTNKSIRQCS